MNLHLIRGRWWPILCTPSGAFLNCQKVLHHQAVCSLLLELTYAQWYNILPVVHLILSPNLR